MLMGSVKNRKKNNFLNKKTDVLDYFYTNIMTQTDTILHTGINKVW